MLLLVFYECQLQLVDYDALLGMMDFYPYNSVYHWLPETDLKHRATEHNTGASFDGTFSSNHHD